MCLQIRGPNLVRYSLRVCRRVRWFVYTLYVPFHSVAVTGRVYTAYALYFLFLYHVSTMILRQLRVPNNLRVYRDHVSYTRSPVFSFVQFSFHIYIRIFVYFVSTNPWISLVTSRLLFPRKYHYFSFVRFTPELPFYLIFLAHIPRIRDQSFVQFAFYLLYFFRLSTLLTSFLFSLYFRFFSNNRERWTIMALPFSRIVFWVHQNFQLLRTHFRFQVFLSDFFVTAIRVSFHPNPSFFFFFNRKFDVVFEFFVPFIVYVKMFDNKFEILIFRYVGNWIFHLWIFHRFRNSWNMIFLPLRCAVRWHLFCVIIFFFFIEFTRRSLYLLFPHLSQRSRRVDINKYVSRSVCAENMRKCTVGWDSGLALKLVWKSCAGSRRRGSRRITSTIRGDVVADAKNIKKCGKKRNVFRSGFSRGFRYILPHRQMVERGGIRFCVYKRGIWPLTRPSKREHHEIGFNGRTLVYLKCRSRVTHRHTRHASAMRAERADDIFLSSFNLYIHFFLSPALPPYPPSLFYTRLEKISCKFKPFLCCTSLTGDDYSLRAIMRLVSAAPHFLASS